MLYLDSNAHVKLNSIFPEILNNYQKLNLGHPLSFSLPGRNATNLIEASREKIAELLGAEQKEQIIFTHGTTQAIEWALEILKYKIENDHCCPNSFVSYSQLEHFSVIDKIEKMNSNFNSCYLDKDTFDFKDKHQKYLIHLLAHNETGVIYNLNSFSSKFIFSDCSQIIGKIPFSLNDYKFDLATFSSHKFGGPTSIGILYIKNLDLWQEFGTGSRYNFDITGTPDTLSIFATAEIMSKIISGQDERINQMTNFQNILEKNLKSIGCEIIGEYLNRLPNTTFIKLPKKWSNEESKFILLKKLEEKEIYPGLGSACGSLHNFENRLMRELGYSESANNYLRISTFGEYDEKDANYISDVFSSIL